MVCLYLWCNYYLCCCCHGSTSAMGFASIDCCRFLGWDGCLSFVKSSRGMFTDAFDFFRYPRLSLSMVTPLRTTTSELISI